MRKINSQLNTILIFLLLTLISIPIILPYFNSGYFPTHDGEWAVVRAVEMFREIRDLQIPPRFSTTLNFGYGYPLFNFAYPFPYYLSFILHLLGLSFVGSIKLLFALSIPLSAIFMFLASRKLWKIDPASILAAVLYIYFPYRMIDLYVRGSLGESIAFVLFPLIIYLLIIYLENKNITAGVLASLSLAILILTHNIMAVYFFIIFAIYFLTTIFTKNIKQARALLGFGILGVGLASYFWLVALAEKKYILLSVTPIADRTLFFPTISQLLLPSWGYSGPTSVGGFSYQIGIPAIILVLLLIALAFYTFVIKKSQNYILLFILALTSVFIFLLLPFTNIIWSTIPLLREINFPWTLLGPIGFLIALGSGALYSNKIFRYALIGVTAFAIIYVVQYAKPERFENRVDEYYISNDATTTSSNELMPLWVKSHPVQMATSNVAAQKDFTISDEVFRSNRFTFTITSNDQQRVRINKIYYPGWNITVDNIPQEILYKDTNGYMAIEIPKGTSRVIGILNDTPLRMVANFTSVFFLLLSFVIIIKRNYSQKIIFK